MVYALTVHCSVPAPPPRARWMDGSAVITTRVSSATMKYATEVSTTVSTGLPARVPGSPAPGGAAPGATLLSRSVILLSVHEEGISTVQTPDRGQGGRLTPALVHSGWLSTKATTS